MRREIVLQTLHVRGPRGGVRAGRTNPLCPVRALRQYLLLTRPVRVPVTHQLFVSFAEGRGGRAIRRPTLAGWLVRAITSAYVAGGRPPPSVTAHSTRSMATSTAWARGASCEEICRAATWASGNTFARFYNLDLPPSHAPGISSHVLGVAGRHR